MQGNQTVFRISYGSIFIFLEYQHFKNNILVCITKYAMITH